MGKIENELGAQTKTLESAAMVLDAAIKGLGALKHQVLENDIGALQLALNDKTAHLAREIGRFESAVAEIDRRAEAGDEQLAASLRDIALGLRSSFDAKSAEIAEWSVRVEREIAAHSVALAAIPPVIKGADAKPFNPRGEWQAGMVANSLDVVSYNGSSYISNEDGNTEKPTRSEKYTTLAKRSGNGAGGATDFGSLTGTILPAQVVPGSATYAVGDVLYAGTTGALSKLGAGSSGQLLSTQGAGAAPRWVSATGGAGDVNGPASATDNAIVRFDGTGGKTVQNSAVTIADTTGDIAGASSLTAPASTALTLAGGTTGASLVLGSGTTAGNATITPTGSGNIVTTSSRNGALKHTLTNANGGTAAYTAMDLSNGSDVGVLYQFGTAWTTSGRFIQASTLLDSSAVGGLTFAASGGAPIRFWSGAELARFAPTTGNLLIGTTTDITGTGGLHVAGTATASTTTSGALRDGSNVGLSGNAGGASYFGGIGLFSGNTLSVAGKLVNSAANGATIPASNGLFQVAGQAVNGLELIGKGSTTDFVLYDAAANTIADVPTSGNTLRIRPATSASNSYTGALVVGNGSAGSAATNVAIGGGKIVAGSTISAGGIVTLGGTGEVAYPGALNVPAASNVTTDLVGYGDGTRHGLIRGNQNGANIADFRFGYWASPTFTESFRVTTAATGLGSATTVVNVFGTNPSTSVGTGALQVAGGIYAGAASVFAGSTTVSPGASVSSSRGVTYAHQLTGTDGVAAAGLMFSSTNTNPVGLLSFAPNTGTLTWAARSAAGNLSGNDLFSIATTGAATFSGAVSLSTAGTTVSIKSGTNAAAGTVTLTGGAATITSTAIDVNTVIVMTIKTKSGSFDHAPSVVVAAGNATIDGHNSDASTYNWVALKVN